MAENKEYYVQEVTDGSIQISEDVVASIAAMAVLEVEGVCGLSGNLGAELAEMLGKKSLGKGIRITPAENDSLVIDCNIVVQFGQAIFDLAKSVQDAVKSSVESVTGLTVNQVNVNISGIAITKDAKK